MGSNILVEFDPATLWYAVSITIAVGWLQSGGCVSYSAAAQAPDTIRSKLVRLGLDVEALESENWNGLRLWDWYSAARGVTSNERLSIPSLKVTDLSIMINKQLKAPTIRDVDRLLIMDDLSCLSRYNDEKSWVEFEITRDFVAPATKVFGIILGVHSESTYKRLEAAVDGIVDIRAEEKEGEVASMLRVRHLRDATFDSKWHRLSADENFGVILEK